MISYSFVYSIVQLEMEDSDTIEVFEKQAGGH